MNTNELLNTIIMILFVIAYVELRLMNVFMKMNKKLFEAQQYFLKHIKDIKKEKTND